MFCKKGVLWNFTKFTGKHLCQSLLAQVFSCEFYQISKNTFFYRTLLVAASEYTFTRYRYVRYWFRFVSIPSSDTDISSKKFVQIFNFLQNLLKTCLQDVFSVTIFWFVLETKKLLRWRRVEDVFKICLEDVFKTPWRPPNVCWIVLSVVYSEPW